MFAIFYPGAFNSLYMQKQIHTVGSPSYCFPSYRSRSLSSSVLLINEVGAAGVTWRQASWRKAVGLHRRHRWATQKLMHPLELYLSCTPCLSQQTLWKMAATTQNSISERGGSHVVTTPKHTTPSSLKHYMHLRLWVHLSWKDFFFFFSINLFVD